MILHTCKDTNDEVYQRWMKTCGAPTSENVPDNLRVPFTFLRVRVMWSAAEEKEDVWAKAKLHWDEKEKQDGEFDELLLRAV